MPGKFLSTKVDEASPPWHDWLKFDKLRLFVARAVCHKNAEFRHFEPIVTKNDILRKSDWTKISRSLRKNQLYVYSVRHWCRFTLDAWGFLVHVTYGSNFVKPGVAPY